MSRRNKPSAPREIVAANDDAAIERLRESRIEASRIRQSGGTVNVDPKTGLIAGAWRKDCFAALLGNSPERGAVVWFEELIRTSMGEGGGERPLDFVRASSEGAPGQNVTDAMMRASELVETVEEALRPWEARLLFRLLDADAALLTRWRPVVQQATGVTNPVAQGERVRMAATSLMWVRDNMGRLQRERRERKAEAAA